MHQSELRNATQQFFLLFVKLNLKKSLKVKTNKSFIKTTSHPIKAELPKVYKISVSMKILTAVNQEKFFAQFVVVST